MSVQIKHAIARLVALQLNGVCRELEQTYSEVSRAIVNSKGTAVLSTVINVREPDGIHAYKVTISEVT